MLAPDPLPTRRSLISRLKNPDDARSWREFYDTYHRLIRAAALRAGIPASEVDDVVQDTLLSVSRNIHKFNPDPAAGSFKNWLFQITHWRIEDRRRRLARVPAALADLAPGGPSSTSTATSLEHRLPDPAPTPATALDRVWAEDWEQNIRERALDVLRRSAPAHHFQIFYLNFVKDMPAGTVARTLGTNIAQVYLVKHRLLGKYKEALRAAQQAATTPRVPPAPEEPQP